MYQLTAGIICIKFTARIRNTFASSFLGRWLNVTYINLEWRRFIREKIDIGFRNLWLWYLCAQARLFSTPLIYCLQYWWYGNKYHMYKHICYLKPLCNGRLFEQTSMLSTYIHILICLLNLNNIYLNLFVFDLTSSLWPSWGYLL